MDPMMNFQPKNHPDNGTRLLAKWMPPPSGCHKLNVDGSYLENSNRMGSGGLIWESDGCWVGGFSSFDGPGKPLLAELLALKHGLNIAWSLGIKELIGECDCMEMVRVLQNLKLSHCHFCVVVVRQVLELLRNEWSVKVYHVFCEANKCANHVVRLGAFSNEHTKVWKSPPGDMGSLLVKNAPSVMSSL